MELYAFVNGEKWKFREDGTVDLGTSAYYRLKGSVKWYPTDTYGRATLDCDAHYDVMICPEGTWPGSPLTISEKLKLFFSE